ncbi:hypothetical protein ACFVW1_53560 [Streptomyces olivochromogenes]|uniref:hypothetical protein n=1 Tax=Streptomyces olivochromogenes TaxID=1963 RepID=UPI0036D990CF
MQGTPLHGNGYVISADEETSDQARCRCHTTLAPRQAQAMCVDHEYERGGALAYLAAYDVHVLTPVHASWANQIEIFSSNFQRKVVSPSNFTDLREVQDPLRAFEDRYNATAQPFQ